jgi:hypothetical protein
MFALGAKVLPVQAKVSTFGLGHLRSYYGTDRQSFSTDGQKKVEKRTKVLLVLLPYSLSACNTDSVFVLPPEMLLQHLL